MVPMLLTGRPMQSRENLQRQHSAHHDSLAQLSHFRKYHLKIPPSDSINCLADVLAGMNDRSSAQTLK